MPGRSIRGRPHQGVWTLAIIIGTNGDDREPFELEGTNAADEILGLGGNDMLVGFGGDDILEGGAGADDLIGGGGIDHANYRSSDTGVSIFLDLFLARGGHAEGDGFSSIEGVIGSAFVDKLVGDTGRNVLRGEAGGDELVGRAGNDKLSGGDGNDFLFGMEGNDELRGGAGIDVVYFSNNLDAVVADLASGTASGGFAGNDRLFGIENLKGAPFGDQLLGNNGVNMLEGEVVATGLATPTRSRARSQHRTASATSAGRRATGSTSPRSTRTRERTATRRSSSLARTSSRAWASFAFSNRTATP